MPTLPITLAMALAAAAPPWMTPLSQTPVADLLGKSPAEVAERLHIEPDHAARVQAAAIVGGDRITVADPDLWLKGSALCGQDAIGRVLAPDSATGGFSPPRFVFVNGRLAHVKSLNADVLTDAANDAGDLAGDQTISLGCDRVTHPPVLESLMTGAVLWPYAAVRATRISSRHSQGAALVSMFKLGAAAPDLDPLLRDHPEAISREDQAGEVRVRIRYGGGDIGGDPHPDQAADYDFHVDITDGRVTAVRQGFLAWAQCTMTPQGAMRCG
jgi:hypothetical protein